MKLRYSVRACFILVAIMACVFAWWRESAVRQQMAVAALRKQGCSIWYENHSLGFVEDTLGIDFVAHVVKVDVPCHLGTYSEHDVHAIVECLKQLSDLKSVYLYGLMDYHIVPIWVEDFASRVELVLPHINIRRGTV